MSIDKRWLAVEEVPASYTKTIGFGNLKGKSDISPQWRIKAMTEVYGLQGEGWKWETTKEDIFESSNGEVLCFVTGIISYVGKDGAWSEPVEGKGGNKLISKNKNGLIPNDEAWKMATTDAMGNAMKGIGIASKVYEGSFDGSKYLDKGEATKVEQQTTLTDEQKEKIHEIVDDSKILDHYLKQWKTTIDTMTANVYANFLPWANQSIAKQRESFVKEITQYHKDNETNHKALENSYKKHFGTLDLNQVSTQKLREYRDYKKESKENE